MCVIRLSKAHNVNFPAPQSSMGTASTGASVKAPIADAQNASAAVRRTISGEGAGVAVQWMVRHWNRVARVPTRCRGSARNPVLTIVPDDHHKDDEPSRLPRLS
jgi:hypothetical protein